MPFIYALNCKIITFNNRTIVLIKKIVSFTIKLSQALVQSHLASVSISLLRKRILSDGSIRLTCKVAKSPIQEILLQS